METVQSIISRHHWDVDNTGIERWNRSMYDNETLVEFELNQCMDELRETTSCRDTARGKTTID